MGNVNLLAALLGAVAFFAVGAVWYSVLFGKAWQAETGFTDEMIAAGQKPGENPMWLIMGLCFLFQLLIAVVLGHAIAMIAPSAAGIMMLALGLAVGVMAPAIGINYLYQAKSGKLYAIDAGYAIVGMAAMGGVFVLLS